MIKVVGVLSILAACIGALALAAGFMGRFHGLGDSLAVFRATIAVATLGLACLCIALGWRGFGLVTGGMAVLALVSLAPHWIGTGGAARASAPGVTVYQKNLWFRMASPDAIVADIRAAQADIVTLQEVSDRNLAVPEALRDLYPTQIVCPYAAVGRVAVLSRFPEIEGGRECVEGQGLVSVLLDTPDGPLRAAAIHLHWPWPYKQRPQVQHLLPFLSEWTEPAVIGGDFNMVRWSHALRSIGQATGTAPVGKARVTLSMKRGFLNLSIDHVLATGGRGENEVRPRAGSDHNGLLAHVAAPAVQAARP